MNIDCTGRAGLMMVVHDLWKPLDEHLAVHVRGFGHVGHVGITIVVVADVFVVELGQTGRIGDQLDSDSRMYQLATISEPSGFAGTKRMISSSRSAWSRGRYGSAIW